MRSAKISREVLDTIVELMEKGVARYRAAQICKVSGTTAGTAYAAYKAAVERDMETLNCIAVRSRWIVDWACDKAGIVFDAAVAETPIVDQKQEQKPEDKQEQKLDNTALAFAALLDAVNKNTKEIVNAECHLSDVIGHYFWPDITEIKNAIIELDKRLSAMQLTQQGFRGDMNDCVKKMVEAINVNGDILTKEHDRMIDILGGIKMNTKKRRPGDE